VTSTGQKFELKNINFKEFFHKNGGWQKIGFENYPIAAPHAVHVRSAWPILLYLPKTPSSEIPTCGANKMNRFPFFGT
jgi:hypothetical protein